MKHLPESADIRLLAAQGWLELGNHLEADKELDEIAPQLRAHPDVLELRWEIHARGKKWDACVDIAEALIKLRPDHPNGWIQRSFALHGLRRTQEAFDKLLPAAETFPRIWKIPYNLSCYCAQLQRVEECEAWFKKAMAIDEHTVKRAAIDDPDLKPLWDSLSGTIWKRSR